MQTNHLLNKFLAALAGLALVSCGGLLQSGQDADRTFWLTPLDGPAADGGDAPHALSVSVEVVPGLDSDRLLTLSPRAELNHFAGARWPDHLPEFAGSLLRRSLAASGRFHRVTGEHEARSEECELALVISRFYTLLDDAGSAESVQVALSGELACGDQGRQLEVEAQRRIAGGGLLDVVAAHQQAMDEVTGKLLPLLAPFPVPPAGN